MGNGRSVHELCTGWICHVCAPWVEVSPRRTAWLRAAPRWLFPPKRQLRPAREYSRRRSGMLISVGLFARSTLSASLPATRVEGGHEPSSKDAIGHFGGEPFDAIENPALLVGR